jgi:hypothetical protein
MKRLLALIAVAAALATMGFAQEGRKALSFLDASALDKALGDPASAAMDKEDWAQSLDAALASSTRIGLVRRSSEGEDPLEEAAKLGFDLAVKVKLEPDGSGVAAFWSIFEVYAPAGAGAAHAPAVEGRTEAVSPTQEKLGETFWLGLLTAADKILAETPSAGSSRLRVVAPPGTKIKGLTKATALVPDSGFLELWLRTPSSYAWRASLAGFEDETGLLSLSGPEADLPILFTPRPRASLESGLVGGAFPDLWYTWRFREGRLFARAGLIQFLGGLSLKNYESMTDQPIFASIGLIEPGAGIGASLSPPDDAVKFYVSLDAALRVDLIDDSKVFMIMLDPIAPIELKPAIGLEWEATDRLSLFFELGNSVFPACDGLLMATSMATNDNWPHITGDGFFIELFVARFGVRFPL